MSPLKHEKLCCLHNTFKYQSYSHTFFFYHIDEIGKNVQNKQPLILEKYSLRRESIHLLSKSHPYFVSSRDEYWLDWIRFRFNLTNSI